jgi:hypothetical protein
VRGPLQGLASLDDAIDRHDHRIVHVDELHAHPRGLLRRPSLARPDYAAERRPRGEARNGPDLQRQSLADRERPRGPDEHPALAQVEHVRLHALAGRALESDAHPVDTRAASLASFVGHG